MAASAERVPNPVSGALAEVEAAAETALPLHRVLCRYAMVLYAPVIVLLTHLSGPFDGILFPIANVVIIVALSWGANGSWRYAAPFRGWQAGMLAAGAASIASIALALLVSREAGIACSSLVVGAVVGAGVARWWGAVRPYPPRNRG